MAVAMKCKGCKLEFRFLSFFVCQFSNIPLSTRSCSYLTPSDRAWFLEGHYIFGSETREGSFCDKNQLDDCFIRSIRLTFESVSRKNTDSKRTAVAEISVKRGLNCKELKASLDLAAR